MRQECVSHQKNKPPAPVLFKSVHCASLPICLSLRCLLCYCQLTLNSLSDAGDSGDLYERLIEVLN